MRTITFLLLIMMTGTGAAIPQEHNNAPSGLIYGKLVDAEGGKPVEYASIALLRSDSTVVTGMLSKGNGDFSLEHLAPGRYIIRINFIGYSTVYKNVSLAPKQTQVDVGNIKLSANAKSLAGVEVIGEKPT